MDQDKAKKIFNEAQNFFIKKNYSLARENWLKILKIYPKNLSILRNIALTYFYENKLEENEQILKKIIDINIKEPNALTMLIFNLEDQDKISEAKEFISLGLKENVLDENWKFKQMIMQPIIKLDIKEIDIERSIIEKNVDKVLSEQKEFSFNIDNHLIKPAHFSLSYDHNDNLIINKKFIKFFKKIYPELNTVYKINNFNNSKIKIGFISEYFTDHTIGKLFKGIILNLDSKIFDINIFHTDKTKKGKILQEFLDAEKKQLIKNHFLPKLFKEKQKLILKHNLDILFYPEIGLSLQLYYLSFLKLAKIQITSWGHPETTGNPSIDYFLTSKLIESTENQKNFSEKLIFSDLLPMYYYYPKVKNKLNLDDLNKKDIFSCPQTLFKIHPDFDQIIAKVQKDNKKAKFYFIKDANNTLYKKLLVRFKKNQNIDVDRITFLDGLNWEEYINHCGKSTVLLDPLHYGAGNSFYESMVYGTPTITMPTKYTKSRLVLGAYKQMEIEDLKFDPIAKSVDNYVEKIIELNNKKDLIDLKQNLQNKAKENLFENKKIIQNLEKIFQDLIN